MNPIWAEITLAKWLAKKAIKQHWKEMGTLDIDPVELTKAANVYLRENRWRLREEARAILTKV
jgi:hypothetical protein